MAEQDNSQEKTEEPTQGRLDRARDEGEVPRSRELTTTILLVVGALSLLGFGGLLAEALAEVMRGSFRLAGDRLGDDLWGLQVLGGAARVAGVAVLPVLCALTLAGGLSNLLLGGVVVSPKALAPKLNRLSPLSGLKRMFSSRSLTELGKSVAKVLVIGGPGAVAMWMLLDQVLVLSDSVLERAVVEALWLVALALLVLGASTVVIAAIDIPIQIQQFRKKMRMTHQEMKDEMKNTEGRPEVRARIRQVAQELAMARMADAVPQADLVIVNPDHYAVALRYDSTTMAAPVLVAKGVDFLAERIKQIAVDAAVPIVEQPPLARSIYYHTELGAAIPDGLFVAVAQVLAYVYQLREYRAGRGDRPRSVRGVPIPEELRREE